MATATKSPTYQEQERPTLDKWLELQSPNPSPTPNTFNETPSQPWETIAKMWGNVNTLSGWEQFYASQMQPIANVEITIMAFRGLLTTMRFHWFDKFNNRHRYFNIVSIPDMEERHFLMKPRCIEDVSAPKITG